MCWLGEEKYVKKKEKRRTIDGKKRGRMERKMGTSGNGEGRRSRNLRDGRTDKRRTDELCERKRKTETPSRSACTVVAFISRCQMRPHLKTASSLGCKAEGDATGHESLCVLKKKKKKMPLATSYSHLQDVKSCDSTKRHFAVRD